MGDKTAAEKLQILLPHWVEHNQNHETEFKQWAEQVRSEGNAQLADLLDQAVASMGETDGILQQALEMVGGPAAGGHHHHHHD